MAITVSRSKELQWAKEGRVFHATHGALTTPAAFQTDLVMQTPDLMVRVPKNTVIVPIRVSVFAEGTSVAGVWQCLISACANDPGTSNVTAFTPVNVNTRYATIGSACTCYITATGNTGTAPTGVSDLLRVYVQPRIDNVGTGSANFEQVVYAPLWGLGIPCIVGNDNNTQAFMVYVGSGATTPTGYILAAWAEFTYTEFYAA